jgi:hypothetical protein
VSAELDKDLAEYDKILEDEEAWLGTRNNIEDFVLLIDLAFEDYTLTRKQTLAKVKLACEGILEEIEAWK